MDAVIKQGVPLLPQKKRSREITISSSSSSGSDFSGLSSGDESPDVEIDPERKRLRPDSVLPLGFLDPLEKPLAVEPLSIMPAKQVEKPDTTVAMVRGSRQFWKAGDYEASSDAAASEQVSRAEMEHVRVHPKFLHSNATSHKWALGAFAELLDNALDEEMNGATYVLVDVLKNMKDKNKMVLVQDDGGGMTPNKMRQCMSLGYSEKSKLANTIGQYGNGFKTSTMRLGADVIVFSRCKGKYGSGATQSIGLLSYTFLMCTGKEDIVVPMIDYEKIGETWNKQVRCSSDSWQRNLETIVQWSPFETEEDLVGQFDFLSEQGTRIIIYNLWEEDQGLLELDFDTDPHDIQIRGVNRDETMIEMSKSFPSSMHYHTYRHSLRSYTSILYLRIPPGFRIILRGKDVEHHNIVNDMMHTKELVYRPTGCGDSAATVTLGFIKDAHHHIDVQGFNVYHKNRLITPFWRVWNAAGSDGRGVVGVLQANFVEPAHDKQGFESTPILSRLQSRLIQIQKNYWSSQCQFIGYAQRRNFKKPVSPEKEPSPCAKENSNSKYDMKQNVPSNGASTSKTTNINEQRGSPANEAAGRNLFEAHATKINYNVPPEIPSVQAPAQATPINCNFPSEIPSVQAQAQATPINCNFPSEIPSVQAVPMKVFPQNLSQQTEGNRGDGSVRFPSMTNMVIKLKEENFSLKNCLNKALRDLNFQKEKNRSQQNQLTKMDQEQETLVNIFSEERSRREKEEETLRKRLEDASETIQGLLRKVKTLEAKNGLL